MDHRPYQITGREDGQLKGGTRQSGSMVMGSFAISDVLPKGPRRCVAWGEDWHAGTS